MIKRKWYERVPAAALAAMLMVNGGGTNLQVKAEVVSVSEEDSTDAKRQIAVKQKKRRAGIATISRKITAKMAM